jgi:hypothetical protein
MQPGVIALLVVSLGTAGLLLYAARIALQTLTRWDLGSGSKQQLLLERKTALVSTIVTFVLGFQVVTLALFVYTVDALHPLFAGSMCAAGTLNVNSLGYPALMLKLLCTLLAGVWMIINRADYLAHDFPLLKVKFALLLILAPLAILEAGTLTAYFFLLTPDVITSCCGSLFEAGRATLGGLLAGLTPLPTAVGFYLLAAVTILNGVITWRTGKGVLFLAGSSIATFISGISALIAFFCLYYYEIPTHHCPFCLLQMEYGRIGYLLYGLLISGVVAGCGAGVISLYQQRPSLKKVAPGMLRNLALGTAISFSTFTLLVTIRLLTTPFRLN